MSEMDVLEQVEKQTGQTPDELKAMPRLPECAFHIWQMFCHLSGARQNGMSVNPISYSEIRSYCSLYRITLTEWELEALTGIDQMFLASVNEK